jgi:glutamyl-tRNA synthetase
MPLTLDPQKRKISKRAHGEVVAVQYYRDRGFLPWALVNFLVLLGWSTSDNREIFSRDELIEAFSLEGISRANAVFDVKKDDPKFFTDPKAISINTHYVRSVPLEELEPYVKGALIKGGIWDPSFERSNRDWFLRTVDLIRSRCHVTTDFVPLGRPYFAEDYPIDPKALRKNILKHEGLKEWFPILADRMEGIETFSVEETERVVREVAEELEIKAGILINGMRTAITGLVKGPGMFDVLTAIGQDRVVERLRNAVTLFE